MSQLFAFGNVLVMPFWLPMILAPRWRWTRRLMSSPLVVAGPLVLYAVLVLPQLLALLPALARPELPAIAALLGTPQGATIAWMHFLAFDLFVARWIYLDVQERGWPAWLLSPLLALTLMFGPLGLGAYLGLRAVGLDSLRAFADRARAGSRPLWWLTLGSAALLAVSLALQMIDARQVTGAPVWMKPAKFGASVALTAPVLAWILAQLPRTRWLRRAAAVIATVTGLELVIITVQAARGVASHFNNATPLDTALFTTMGLGITLVWLAELYIAVRAFRHRFATPARTWAIRLGLAGALAGGAVGFLMPRPTPAQLDAIRTQHHSATVGAHAVGVRDGGPGLPLTRWSTEGGDLRVPHFIGLHALQLLPLFAWVLERRRRPASTRLVVAAGAGWLGLIGLTLWQALRGQPLVAPDAATLLALVVLAAGTLAVALFPAGARQPVPAQAGA
jgi:ABA DEFICIENT 4-like